MQHKYDYIDNSNVNDRLYDVEVTKICASLYNRNIFWITKQGQLYCAGDYNNFNSPFPKHIDVFPSAVIDLKGTKQYHFALCDNHRKIKLMILFWIKDNKDMKIPDEVQNLIGLFYDYKTSVYASSVYKRTDFAKIAKFETDTIGIKQIACSENNCLFLDFEGRVYIYTYSLETKQQQTKPKLINFFNDNGVIIDKICCGEHVNYALSETGKVYEWITDICSVASLNNYDIVDIQAGGKMLYARSEDNQHFIYGNDIQCKYLDQEDFDDAKLFTIGNNFNQLSGGKRIREIYLGHKCMIIATLETLASYSKLSFDSYEQRASV